MIYSVLQLILLAYLILLSDDRLLDLSWTWLPVRGTVMVQSYTAGTVSIDAWATGRRFKKPRPTPRPLRHH